MASLMLDSAIFLLREYMGWFGPPALLRCKPAQVRKPAEGNARDDSILDGYVRIQACASNPFTWQEFSEGRFPHVVFPPGSAYSIDKARKSLPRMLVAAGHHKRAWLHVPECWRDSPRAIEAHLNIPLFDAIRVYLSQQDFTPKPKRFRSKEWHDYKRIVRRIEARLAAHLIDGETCSLDDIAEILGMRWEL